MIKVYADYTLVYSTFRPDLNIVDLKVTLSAHTSGTATCTLPSTHPSYNRFVNYKTIITIYRRDVLLFRGRVLYFTDDLYKNRTFVCEGERGFLQDSVIRPYLYQDSPSAIFADLIATHNSQVDREKSFVVGTVTVTDPNNYTRLESGSAELTSDVLDKLVERVGGYIVFTTNSDGDRVINWYDDPGYRSNQTITFGSNLLDYTRTGINTDLATAIIPYGAADEITGERLTIESVNDGLDYIKDDEAVALRGLIFRPVFWDEVTAPENLLKKAQQYLSKSKNMVDSLQVTAVDLSAVDKNIDTFQVLDKVRVQSSTDSSLAADFLLTDRTYNLLDPSQDTIVLGKEVVSLSGADASGDWDNQNAINRVETTIRQEYTANIEQAVKTTTESYSSLIQQTEKKIMSEVSEAYYTGEEVDKLVRTSMEQTVDGWSFDFETLEKKVDENDAEARAQYEEVKKYIRFVNGNILLGEEKNPLELKIQKDRISFFDDGAEVAYFSNKKLTVYDGNFLNSLTIGSFAFIPRTNGNLSLVKVG